MIAYDDQNRVLPEELAIWTYNINYCKPTTISLPKDSLDWIDFSLDLDDGTLSGFIKLISCWTTLT